MLAGLVLGSADLAAFDLEAAIDSHRYVNHYFGEEVFAVMPNHLHGLLLDTCVTEVLEPDPCRVLIQRGEAPHSSVHGDVVDLDVALGQQLFGTRTGPAEAKDATVPWRGRRDLVSVGRGPIRGEHDMVKSRTFRTLLSGLAGLALIIASASVTDATPAPSSSAGLLPIVFVHGQSGSAQQFETQAMRFTSNGYPQDLLYAFEYDTGSGANPLGDLDGFLDMVLAETGAGQVVAIGHSRGTTVWTSYLDDAAYGPAKVARYVNIDGRTSDELPGGVPTIGIWGEWNTAGSGYNRRGDTDAQIGPDPAANFYFGTKSHTETATSAEAFAVMYEFITGSAPATTDVVPEPPGAVTIAGRAVLFPANVGYAGATLEVWRVDAATGGRIDDTPRATVPIGASGEFGPVKVNGKKHWELALVRPEDGSVHHFYFEPFHRSDHFIRLNSSRPGEGLEAFVPRSDDTTNLVVVRQREFWGDQGATSDVLDIDGTNVLAANTSPRSSVNLAVFTFDDELDGVTDLSKGELFPFNFLAFLTAVDVSIASSPDASGVVSVTDVARGHGSTTLNVPNWPSTTHRITVQFGDADQGAEGFTEYPPPRRP